MGAGTTARSSQDRALPGHEDRAPYTGPLPELVLEYGTSDGGASEGGASDGETSDAGSSDAGDSSHWKL